MITINGKEYQNEDLTQERGQLGLRSNMKYPLTLL